MPEALKQSEVEKGQDPSVAKQWDDESPVEKKFEDLYAITDKLKVGILGTYRPGVGPVGRAMAVAKRSGPDFLFLANRDSQKFKDLEAMKETTVAFFNSSTMDWVSVTGDAVTMSNEDPRIKDVWSKASSVWFGDLGDGVHTGGPEDPRMKLIELRAKYISYWKNESSTLGMIKEIGGAMLTGGVPKPGVQREMKEEEIKWAREHQSALTS